MPKATIRNSVGIYLAEIDSEATFYTFDGLIDQKEHLLISFEGDREKSPLVRVHSECLTGDVFQSKKCDCGPQLKESMKILSEKGGLLLYLRQEGRGIGLYNKLDTYKLQECGYDTFESNNLLGFKDDLREYKVVIQMLRAIDIDAIKLITNNPDKVEQIEVNGIKVVQRLSTGAYINAHNESYLRSKVERQGHKIAYSF
ncbi:GTP cyclohydrolase II RibA [Exilibacterium tricleocarpae]|uniref:GTP cyclohydrolase II n=1 Tax=Exilibacterium tricleocarpae TaxID=2591008 RepID=A0A545SRW7_9GAMM|nr:GTP cyclohydrolase II RibA [Exilibacterium tricleocarpae]